VSEWLLQTRSEALDYRVVGGSDEALTWCSVCSAYIAYDYPICVIETLSADEGWRLYLTGMDAGRKDGASPPRGIRNSLLVLGKPSERDLACSLVRAFFQDTLAGPLRGVLHRDVAEAAVATGALDPDTRAAIDALLSPAGPAVAPHLRTGLWAGTRASSAVQEAFLSALAAAIDTRQAGLFADLNLMSTADEAGNVMRAGTWDVGVFLFSAAPDALTPFDFRRAPGHEDPPPAGASRGAPAGSQGAKGRPRYEVVVLVLVVLVVVLLTMCRNGL
jgi:hypothetical protein